jgi:hypothetical protein
MTLERVQVVIGPKLPGERVSLSTGWASASKVFSGALRRLRARRSGGRNRGLPDPRGLPLPLVLRELPLSNVETDGLSLYVSQLFAKAQIPLTEISAVRLGLWPTTRIIVEFRSQTAIGPRLSFEPPGDWMATAYDHRSVRELRALVAQAKAAAAQDAAADGAARGSSAR